MDDDFDSILERARRLSPNGQRRLIAALSARQELHGTSGTRRQVPSLAVLANGVNPLTGRALISPDIIAPGEMPSLDAADAEASIHRRRVDVDNGHLGLLHGISYDELAEAGWAIVVNATDDSSLIEALALLINRRASEQDLRLPELRFRRGETCGMWLARHVADINRPMAKDGRTQVPVFLHRPGDGVDDWLGRHGASARAVDPELGVPFYLLLVGRPGPVSSGDTAYIPYEFQYQLDLFWGVGRICFSDLSGEHRLSDYAAYAEHLCAFEHQSQGSQERRIVYFGTEHRDDRATEASANRLLRPLFQGRPTTQSSAARYGFTQDLRVGSKARCADLAAILGGENGAGPPAILFTATHGLGFDAADPLLPSYQGALVCQDWSGEGAVRREHWFGAEDLASGWDLHGMIAICIACYGLGCPQEDQMIWARGEQARPVAPRALVAQLPQALLLRGALAVFGHIDRAWTYAFQGPTAGLSSQGARTAAAQVQAFEDVLRRLMDGKRLGYATDQFNGQQGTAAVTFADLLVKAEQSTPSELIEFELSLAWVLKHDLRNYAVLGDPAIRLRV